MKRIDAAHAQPERPLMLGDETSPWRSELYIEATKDVPGAEMAHLSGTYLAKVFEGSFRDAQKWERDMTRFVERRGQHVGRFFFGYTTCPRCAKAYGKNYVVMLAQIDVPPHGDTKLSSSHGTTQEREAETLAEGRLGPHRLR